VLQYFSYWTVDSDTHLLVYASINQ
jgi:hypothetical protein